MNIKSILLGTAAGLMAVSAAHAADLPGEAVPAAVDYVKVCDAFGSGFFYIPGTETCLDISGRVRVKLTTDFDTTADVEANGRVQFDARTATEYGTLRSFFELKSATTADVDVGKAFIQLGYLTLGYAGDLMDSFGGVYGDTDRNQFGDTQLVAQIVAPDLGGGFFAGVGAGIKDTDPLAADLDTGDFTLEAMAGITSGPLTAAVAVGYLEATESFQVKAHAAYDATDALSVAAQVAYDDDAETTYLAAGVSYGATDALTVYANVGYDIKPGDDVFGVTVGADYTVVSGLVLTSEVVYDDGTEDFSGLLMLSRTW